MVDDMDPRSLLKSEGWRCTATG